MTTSRKLAPSFVLLAALLVPGVALGQDAPTAPAPAGSSDLSQINGIPVKVGEHNEYHYNFRRWNFATNPLGWIVGFYGASLSYAFHDNVVVRVDANLIDPPGSGDARGSEIGVGLPIYLRRAYQGPFLEPGFIVRRMTNDNGVADSKTGGPQVLVGWHWSWDSGLNLALAFGAGRNWSNDEADFGGDEIFGNGYLRFGYAF